MLGVFVVDITETVVVDKEDADGVVDVEDVSTFVVEENDVVDEVVDIEEVVEVEVEVEVEVKEVVEVVVVDDMVDSAVLTMVSGMSLQHVRRSSLIINKTFDVFNWKIETGIKTFFYSKTMLAIFYLRIEMSQICLESVLH